ncbi:MAG TPA: hypothetical protein VK427_21670, partial [Kofleriaceae bacterium]|nr:hypothetical protein [Kofleriaceae bacterium]
DVAMLDPSNLGAIDELRIRTQLNIRPYLCGPRMVERALVKYYGAAASHNAAGYEIPVHISGPIPVITGSIPTVTEGVRTYPPAPSKPSAHPARNNELLSGSVSINSRDDEIDALQARISKLEALVARDDDVLRKLLALLIEKGLTTRDEIVERLG